MLSRVKTRTNSYMDAAAATLTLLLLLVMPML